MLLKSLRNNSGNTADVRSRTGRLFRHSMATMMLENGADIRYIQQMLGHADLKMMQIYIQVSIRQLKRIHLATHPARLEQKPVEEPEKK